MSDYLKLLSTFAHELAAGVIIVAVALLLSLVLRRLINTLRDSKHLATIMARRLQTYLMYTTLSVQPAEAEGAEAPQLLHIPNNLFFQKVLRTRSSHERGSKASFFSQQDC